MKASYKLQLEQHQRRLGMSHKELNKYDKKHNDINLIRYLQSLELNSTAPSGFWGIFVVSNEPAAGSSPRHMHVYLAYNDIPLTPSHQINSDQSYTFNISEEDRLPLPSSTLQLKITFQNGTQSVDINAWDGFEPTGTTNNPLNEENTLSMLVNQNNYDDGQCSITFVVSFEPF